MIIDKIILDDLTEKAKQSQRLRCNVLVVPIGCLRD